MSRTFVKLLTWLLLSVAAASCSDGNRFASPEADGADARRAYRGPGRGNTVTLQSGTFEPSVLPVSTVGNAGATFTITNPADPLFGTTIVVPPGTIAGTVTLSVTSAPVTSMSGLPEGASVRSRLIRVSAVDENQAPVGDFGQLVTITLPYEPTTDHVNFYKIEAGGFLEPVGFEAMNRETRRITFVTHEPGGSRTDVPSMPGAPLPRTTIPSTVSFGSYVAIGLAPEKLIQWMNEERSIDTGFRPSRNGWSIPNYGSYYRDSRGGNCLGMVSFAKWYYRSGYGPDLVDNYRDPDKTAAWSDDAPAIELASLVQNEYDQTAERNEEVSLDLLSAGDVARSMVGALYVTRAPAMLSIGQVVNNVRTGGHAISTYRVDLKPDGSMTFHIYDPNKQANDAVRIEWAPATGFANYLSGTDAASSAFTYNQFRHRGYYFSVSENWMRQAKASADAGFPASVFPKITLTTIQGKNLYDNLLLHPGTTPPPGSHPKYTTADNAVTIEGTVLGGNAQVAGQVVDQIRIVTPVGSVTGGVNNQAGGGDGSFGFSLPLKSGINQIAFIARSSRPTAANPNGWRWAGFSEVYLESTAAPSAFTVTLNWNRGTSDVDLYVKEPDGVAGTPTAGKVGDVVYYGNRAYSSATSPYLDFDNTSGFGPEHYIAKQGMATKFTDGSLGTSINGTYTLGVHYYSWHGDYNAEDKSIGWNVSWRYLSACNSPCSDPETQGLWVTGSRSGSIANGNSGQAGRSGFASGGASWSSKWNIDYPTPQMNWVVPPSNTVMLP